MLPIPGFKAGYVAPLPSAGRLCGVCGPLLTKYSSVVFEELRAIPVLLVPWPNLLPCCCCCCLCRRQVAYAEYELEAIMLSSSCMLTCALFFKI
jgi:hypothetical protein